MSEEPGIVDASAVVITGEEAEAIRQRFLGAQHGHDLVVNGTDGGSVELECTRCYGTIDAGNGRSVNELAWLQEQHRCVITATVEKPHTRAAHAVGQQP
jgi:hypothetical protein